MPGRRKCPCHLIDSLLPGVRAEKDISRTKTRMISIFTRTARGPRNTLDSIATPVKAYGAVRRPPRPAFEVTICDLNDSGLHAAMREPI